MKYILPSITLLVATGAQAELIIHQAPTIQGVVAEPVVMNETNPVLNQSQTNVTEATHSPVLESQPMTIAVTEVVDTPVVESQPVTVSEPVQAVAPIAAPVVMSSTKAEPENRILGLKYAEGSKPFVVFAEAGILGLGVGAGFSLNPYLDIVAGYNGGKYNVENLDVELMSGTKLDKVDYDSKVQYVAANIRPFAGRFHISLGFYNQDINFKGQYSPSDFYLMEGEAPEYVFNDATFDANTVGNVKLDIGFEKKILPYVGIGWSPKIGQRWGLSTQLGAMYAGKAEVAYYPENGHTSIQDKDKTTTLGEALKVEQDNFSTSLKWIPVAKMGLWVRF